MYDHRDKCPEDGTNPQDKSYQTVINPGFFRLLSFRGGGRGILVLRREYNGWQGCSPSGGGRGVCGTVLLKHVYINHPNQNSCFLVKKTRPQMLGQGQIQDLSEGGGQEFLGTKN